MVKGSRSLVPEPVGRKNLEIGWWVVKASWYGEGSRGNLVIMHVVDESRLRRWSRSVTSLEIVLNEIGCRDNVFHEVNPTMNKRINGLRMVGKGYSTLHNRSFIMLSVFFVVSHNLFEIGEPRLTLDYYAKTCPNVLQVVRKEMEYAVLSEPCNAAFVVRLHFHDCFIQGCDESVLLDDNITLQGEKKASINIHSFKGFKIIDRIKNNLESECPGIVSYADIVTIAARDTVILVGSPYWDVPLGRKDSTIEIYELANSNLPSVNEGLLIGTEI
ncbi:peroxidase 11-like [Benincasa hispida]|uniref:peroxidase 11-like n=1 Tax=Benincasa hispida TaxID=102211 RepID=UPI0019008173|nr:peroxidase 11-like [Benincasa hispida]